MIVIQRKKNGLLGICPRLLNFFLVMPWAAEPFLFGYALFVGEYLALAVFDDL